MLLEVLRLKSLEKPWVWMRVCVCVCVLTFLNLVPCFCVIKKITIKIKMKVTTKRRNWTGMSFQSIHYYPYLQLGIPTPAQCNRSFSLRTPDVRERAFVLRKTDRHEEKTYRVVLKMNCQLKNNSSYLSFRSKNVIQVLALIKYFLISLRLKRRINLMFTEVQNFKLKLTVLMQHSEQYDKRYQPCSHSLSDT